MNPNENLSGLYDNGAIEWGWKMQAEKIRRVANRFEKGDFLLEKWFTEQLGFDNDGVPRYRLTIDYLDMREENYL